MDSSPSTTAPARATRSRRSRLHLGEPRRPSSKRPAHDHQRLPYSEWCHFAACLARVSHNFRPQKFLAHRKPLRASTSKRRRPGPLGRGKRREQIIEELALCSTLRPFRPDLPGAFPGMTVTDRSRPRPRQGNRPTPSPPARGATPFRSKVLRRGVRTSGQAWASRTFYDKNLRREVGPEEPRQPD